MLRLPRFDTVLSDSLLDAVHLHRWRPWTAPNGDNTLLVTTLRTGQGFDDPVSGLRLVVGSIANNTAVVNLDGFAASCAPAAPVVTLSPARVVVVAPGCNTPQTVDIQVRVCVSVCLWVGGCT